MDPRDRLPALRRLPALLPGLLQGMGDPDLRRRPATGFFAVVEHAWHLADLEAEGFGVRIARLVAEEAPLLPDFDGDAVARQRGYASRDAALGVRRFAAAREANLSTLGALPAEAWRRAGRQEGVGPLVLADLPGMMWEHDRAHASQLGDLLAGLAPGHPSLPALRELAADERWPRPKPGTPTPRSRGGRLEEEEEGRGWAGAVRRGAVR
jgi:hypothetical protein